MTWNKERLTYFNDHDDFHIAPFRASGVAGTPTWIWSVVVDGRLFVRAYNGVHSSWYQSAMAQHDGNIVSNGERLNVIFKSEKDPTILDKIDEAYHVKYDPSPYVAPMLSEKTRNATVEVLPK
ncbi:DUF2255 family protein [Weissella paramesenteroides]|jgi:hypothetical protein|nr:DUF2255 family protein [Weissella paramesenteroides]KAA8437700.1 DUF2255 family protein [Weissella paramesenteroides]